MLERTKKLWEKQDRLVGDRFRLFAAVAEALEVERVLYPGSYVDVAPSFVWPLVTYVDVDKRANQFFADEDGVRELIAGRGVDGAQHAAKFVHADYTSELGLPADSYDLLISLYAGFISEHCTHYLRCGGHLLVNPSHGDAAMASLDERYTFRGVVIADDENYSVRTDELDTYLVPKKKDVVVTVELLHESGRGIGYTTSPFAYLFELTG